MTTARAILKNVPISPLKCVSLAKVISGMKAELAINMLQFDKTKAGFQLKKALMSAVANAENNNNLDIDDLIIDKVLVNKAKFLRRWKARAKGRSSRIIKRYSHIKLYLKEK
jgi:large subunit ribosomal protein L22